MGEGLDLVCACLCVSNQNGLRSPLRLGMASECEQDAIHRTVCSNNAHRNRGKHRKRQHQKDNPSVQVGPTFERPQSRLLTFSARMRSEYDAENWSHSTRVDAHDC